MRSSGLSLPRLARDNPVYPALKSGYDLSMNKSYPLPAPAPASRIARPSHLTSFDALAAIPRKTSGLPARRVHALAAPTSRM